MNAPAATAHQLSSSSSSAEGTPAVQLSNDIPIDPALSTPTLDPALSTESVVKNSIEFKPEPESRHTSPPQLRLSYSQGPQGDPFAPQPSPSYFHDQVTLPSPPPTKPVKKKRKPRREALCSFCAGDDSKSPTGEPERMVSCTDCGRSGHPTCLQLGERAEALRGYEWQCNDCKTCESCQEKDGDNRFLLCDSCDRGWHMDCLDPPLAQAPPGKWHCPRCPPISNPEAQPQQDLQPPELDFIATCPAPLAPPPAREGSVTSSTHSGTRKAASKNRKRGKSRVLVTDESEVEAEGTAGPSRPSRRSTQQRPTVVTDLPSVTEVDIDVVDLTSPEHSRPHKRQRIRLSSPIPPLRQPVIRLKLPPRNKGKERATEEPDDTKKGFFDDVLPLDERDTSSTTIANPDKLRFERSRTVAEEKLMPPPPIPHAIQEETVAVESPSRPLRSSHQSIPKAPATSISPVPSTPLTVTSPDNYLRIRYIRFGEFDIQTWYDAPFPEEYMTIPDGRLWICEFCLKYMKSKFNAMRHRLKCKMRHPPGDEIYRDGVVTIWEVDGRKNKIYCQNLCLLSKMFLDHKSLFYDVEPFLFYVITEVDDVGARFVGYFSKEKRSPKDYNVSCIMTLPVRQRQGWGNLLIDFSYLLSKKERRTGSPEKPLSALGALGYKNYWTLAIMRYLRTAPADPSLQDISTATSMTLEDICFTLNHLRMLDIHDRVPTPRPLPGQSIKSSKSRKSGVARKALQRTTTHDDDRVKGPFVPPASYTVTWDRAVVEGYMSKWESKGYLKLKPENLKWSPFLIARTMKSDGLPTESELGSDAVPPSATDSVTPSLDTPNTPRPRTSDRLNALRTSETPAHALFDDDDVELVRPSASTLPVLGSAHDHSSSSRRGRSNSPAGSDSTPIRKRPRRSTTLASTPRVRPDRPIHVRRTRSVAQLPQLRDEADLIAEDAALAARLAMEEGRQRRQLRSRSNTEQEHQRPVSPSTPKTSSNPRKRKRPNTPPPPPSPVSTRHTRSQGAVAPVVEPPAPARRPSNKSPSKKRRPEGRKRDREREKKRRREKKRLEQQQLASSSMVPEPEQEQEPPRSPTPSPSAAGDGIVQSPAAMETKIEDAAQAMSLLVPESAAKEDDTQVEDMDTPSAGATSRQSVGHSDDTVYATEDHPVQHKVSPVPVVAPTKVSNGVLPQAVSNGGPPHTDLVLNGEALTGDPDVDAEEDVDAEGEPDEGEEDVDAEGEPDNGDDDIDIEEPY